MSEPTLRELAEAVRNAPEGLNQEECVNELEHALGIDEGHFDDPDKGTRAILAALDAELKRGRQEGRLQEANYAGEHRH